MFRTWSGYPITICVIHLDHALPNLRLVRLPSRRRARQVELAYDCAIPAFAEALCGAGVVEAMVEQGLERLDVQGRDVLVTADDLPHSSDPDEDAMADVAALTAIWSRVDADLTPWAKRPAHEVPIPPG